MDGMEEEDVEEKSGKEEQEEEKAAGLFPRVGWHAHVGIADREDQSAVLFTLLLLLLPPLLPPPSSDKVLGIYRPWCRDSRS